MDSAEVRGDENLALLSGPGNSEGRICREAGQGFWKKGFRVFRSYRLEDWSHQGQKRGHRVWKRSGMGEGRVWVVAFTPISSLMLPLACPLS